MSDFNDANEWASNLVFGTHYHNNEPREQGKPKCLVFTLTRKIVISADAETHEEWVKVAGEIHDVLNEGFWFRGEGSEAELAAAKAAAEEKVWTCVEGRWGYFSPATLTAHESTLLNADDLETIEESKRVANHGCDGCPQCVPPLDNVEDL